MERHEHTAYSLLELLVSIAVVSAVIAVALPALSGVRWSMRELGCVAGMRNSAQAVTLYGMDHQGLLPYGGEA